MKTNLPEQLPPDKIQQGVDRFAEVSKLGLSDDTLRQCIRGLLKQGATVADFRRLGDVLHKLARNENFRRVTEPKPGTFKAFTKAAKK